MDSPHSREIHPSHLVSQKLKKKKQKNKLKTTQQYIDWSESSRSREYFKWTPFVGIAFFVKIWRGRYSYTHLGRPYDSLVVFLFVDLFHWLEARACIQICLKCSTPSWPSIERFFQLHSPCRSKNKNLPSIFLKSTLPSVSRSQIRELCARRCCLLLRTRVCACGHERFCAKNNNAGDNK